jgi:flagellar M-ring protein FliF
MRAANLGVMALLGLIVLLMVVRPLVRRIITPDMPAGAAAAAVGGDGAPGAGGAAVAGTGIAAAGGPNVSIISGEQPTVAINNRTSTMIDIAKVQGQVHAQSVQKVGELAEKNPHEAVSVIRSWLHEDAA